jgi:hypothetical protein
MFGIVPKAEWKPGKPVFQLVRGEALPEDSWQRRFYAMGYCNCACHNHAEKHTTESHCWGECQCYHPDKVYHDDGVLTANPVRLLPTDHYDDSLKHDGGATAGVMAILQSSIKPKPKIKVLWTDQSPWYVKWYYRVYDFFYWKFHV